MTALIQFHQHGLYVACMWLAKLVQLPVAMHLRRRGGEGRGGEGRGVVTFFLKRNEGWCLL